LVEFISQILNKNDQNRNKIPRRNGKSNEKGRAFDLGR
jgi:hypothetical protein